MMVDKWADHLAAQRVVQRVALKVALRAASTAGWRAARTGRTLAAGRAVRSVGGWADETVEPSADVLADVKAVC